MIAHRFPRGATCTPRGLHAGPFRGARKIIGMGEKARKVKTWKTL